MWRVENRLKPLSDNTTKSVTYQGFHLAFLKLFASNNMIWPLGHCLAILNIEENFAFKRPALEKSEQNVQHYMIMSNFLKLQI